MYGPVGDALDYTVWVCFIYESQNRAYILTKLFWFWQTLLSSMSVGFIKPMRVWNHAIFRIIRKHACASVNKIQRTWAFPSLAPSWLVTPSATGASSSRRGGAVTITCPRHLTTPTCLTAITEVRPRTPVTVYFYWNIRTTYTMLSQINEVIVKYITCYYNIYCVTRFWHFEITIDSWLDSNITWQRWFYVMSYQTNTAFSLITTGEIL